MKIKLFFLLFLLNTTINAQTKCDCFDRLYNLSNNYSSANNWPMAIEALKDAISFLDKKHLEGDYYYLLAQDYMHYNKKDSAAVYFTKAIELGYEVRWIKEGYPDVFYKLDSNKIRKYTLAYRSKIDFDLYDKFVGILALDQAPRMGLLFPEEELSKATPEKTAIIDSIYDRIDSNTFEFVSWVLETYGYPTANKLGFYPSGFMIMLLHLTAFDNARSRKILSQLTALNEQCDFPQKSTILFLKDRQKLYKEGKYCCGLMGSGNRYTRIEDVNKTDSIRLLYNQVRLKEEVSVSDTTSAKSRQELDAKGYKPAPYPKNYFCKEKYHFE